MLMLKRKFMKRFTWTDFIGATHILENMKCDCTKHDVEQFSMLTHMTERSNVKVFMIDVPLVQ